MKISFISCQGGTIVNADFQFAGDVLIKDGFIAEVGQGIKAGRRTRVIDAAGKLVMPGGIDPHTHLAMPFMGQVACDDFFSGQAAALAGGTTYHIDFALPVDHNLLEGYKVWREKAEASVMDYSFHMAVTKWSVGVGEQMRALTERHGINSFKFFMAYKGALMVTDDELLAGMRQCRELKALVQVHAENGDAVADGQRRVYNSGVTGPEGHALSRPEGLEAEATSRAIRLAEFVGTPLYVVHIMSGQAAAEVAAAKSRGARIVGETVTSAISLNESYMWHPNFTMAAQYVMSPPIRSTASGTAVRSALAGGIVQVLGTDHAVFNSTQKAVGKHDFRLIPNGVNGIEERIHIAWQVLVNSGLVTPSDFVRAISTAAAQAFNIYPKKGIIAAGSDADVIIFDPEIKHVISAATHHSRMDTNIYEGRRVKGKVTTTVSRGRVVWHDGMLNVEKGSGRYIPLQTGGELFRGLDAKDAASKVLYGGAPVERNEIASAAMKDEL